MKRLLSFKNLGLVALLVGSMVFAQVFSANAQFTTGFQQQTSGLQQWGGGNGYNLMLTCDTSAHNVHGQLFSSTIGWIYLNCADDTSGASGDFGVSQDSAGKWTGYGWSNSIGWIKFGGLGCPQHSGWNINAAAGATGCDVQRITPSGTSLPIVGWARACSATADPVACTGDNPKSGGWDGWISMSGLNDQNPTAAGLQTTTNYKVALSLTIPLNGKQPITGFVWGGDVVGWAKFLNAYVDTTQIQNAAHLTLTATPSAVSGNAGTVLEYSIPAAEKAYFTGAACTTTSTPAVGTSWDGTQPNFSTSSTTFSKQVTGVSVPANPTTYTISCPVMVPNSNQTVATATTTVTKVGPTITLSIGTHDLCVDGSLGGPQSTTASWVASTGASYCKIFQDGVVLGGQRNPIDSVTLPLSPAVFGSPTSTTYTTPTTAGSPHEYVVRCYDSANAQILPESNHEFVGVAPATFNGTTANGTLNCTQADWGITFGNSGGQGAVCNAQSSSAASLSWSPWGTVPSQYTYAVLKRRNIVVGGISLYTAVGTFALTDTAPAITTPGYYKVFYYTTGGVEAPVTSAEILSQGAVANTNCFSGLPSGGAYCPAGSVNTAAILPKTYSWSSDAASCDLGGPSGSVTITSAPTTKSLTCTWNDGSTATSTATYGPMLSASSAFCNTVPSKGGHPVIIEN